MKKILIPAIALMFICLLSMPQAQASPSINGKLSISVSEVVEGTPVRLVGTDLDASTAYYINITVGSTETQYGPWTTNADGDDIVMTWLAEKPSDDVVATIELCSPAATALDTVVLTVQDVDSFLPTDLLIALGIGILIIAIIVGVVYNKFQKP